MKNVYNLIDHEHHSIFIFHVIGFIYGITLYLNSDYKIGYITCLLIILVILLISFFCFIKSYNLSFYILLFCAFFISGYTIAKYKIENVNLPTLEIHATHSIEAVIERIQPAANNKWQLLLTDLNIDGKKLENAKIRIVSQNRYIESLDNGNIVRFNARLFQPKKPIIEGSFDFGFYMKMSNIIASGYALSNIVKIFDNTNDRLFSNSINANLNHIINSIRQKIYIRLIKILGQENGNFIAAILIGETKGLSSEILNLTRSSGISHILSVSGLHLSLVAMTSFALSRILMNISNHIANFYNIKTIAGIISILFSFIYLLLSGIKIAAVRAFIMTAIFTIAIIIGRSAYPIRSVFIAAFLISLFSPENIMHPSFQLSFVAVLCLISGFNLYLIKNNSGVGLIRSLRGYLMMNIYSSFLASILCAPFIMYHFYQVPTYSVLMNLIAVPLMSFIIMPFSLIGLIFINSGLDYYIFGFISIFVNTIIYFSKLIIDLPHSVIYCGNISKLSLLIFSISLFWLSIFKTNFKFLSIPLMILSFIMMYYTPKASFLYIDHAETYVYQNMDKKDEKFEILHNLNLSEFDKNFIKGWLGQKYITSNKKDPKLLDLSFKLDKDRYITFNNQKCTDADIMVITSPTLKCNGINLIDYQKFLSINSLVVYCNKDGCSANIDNAI